MKTITLENENQLRALNLIGFTGLIIVKNSKYGWSKTYCKNGVHHCLDGPAIEWEDGNKEWWVEGKLHRTDGPSIIESDGTQYWFIEDSICSLITLNALLEEGNVFLGVKKGRYDLEWLRFFTEKGIQEFPIIKHLEISFILKRLLK